MNFDRDFDAFSAALDDLWAIKGQPLTAGARMAFFRALEAYPLNEVEIGLQSHSRDPERGRFLPMPADVIAQIKGIVANDGRPGPEEAWATALRSRDEAATVVWTAEAAEAMGVCRPLLEARDDIGARMAFKEAYIRLVAAAREARRPPEWIASLGFDDAGRESVLLPHVLAGRLPQDAILSPQIGLDRVLMLAGPERAAPRDSSARAAAMHRLAQLREEMRHGGSSGPSPAEVDKARTEAMKAAARAKVDSYAAGVSA